MHMYMYMYDICDCIRRLRFRKECCVPLSVHVCLYACMCVYASLRKHTCTGNKKKTKIAMLYLCVYVNVYVFVMLKFFWLRCMTSHPHTYLAY